MQSQVDNGASGCPITPLPNSLESNTQVVRLAMVQTALRGRDPGLFMGLTATLQFAQRDGRDAGTEIPSVVIAELALNRGQLS